MPTRQTKKGCQNEAKKKRPTIKGDNSVKVVRKRKGIIDVSLKNPKRAKKPNSSNVVKQKAKKRTKETPQTFWTKQIPEMDNPTPIITRGISQNFKAWKECVRAGSEGASPEEVPEPVFTRSWTKRISWQSGIQPSLFLQTTKKTEKPKQITLDQTKRMPEGQQGIKRIFDSCRNLSYPESRSDRRKALRDMIQNNSLADTWKPRENQQTHSEKGVQVEIIENTKKSEKKISVEELSGMFDKFCQVPDDEQTEKEIINNTDKMLKDASVQVTEEKTSYSTTSRIDIKSYEIDTGYYYVRGSSFSSSCNFNFLGDSGDSYQYSVTAVRKRSIPDILPDEFPSIECPKSLGFDLTLLKRGDICEYPANDNTILKEDKKNDSYLYKYSTKGDLKERSIENKKKKWNMNEILSNTATKERFCNFKPIKMSRNFIIRDNNNEQFNFENTVNQRAQDFYVPPIQQKCKPLNLGSEKGECEEIYGDKVDNTMAANVRHSMELADVSTCPTKVEFNGSALEEASFENANSCFVSECEFCKMRERNCCCKMNVTNDSLLEKPAANETPSRTDSYKSKPSSYGFKFENISDRNENADLKCEMNSRFGIAQHVYQGFLNMTGMQSTKKY